MLAHLKSTQGPAQPLWLKNGKFLRSLTEQWRSGGSPCFFVGYRLTRNNGYDLDWALLKGRSFSVEIYHFQNEIPFWENEYTNAPNSKSKFILTGGNPMMRANRGNWVESGAVVGGRWIVADDDV